jgi:hypothetical protein
LVVLAHQRLVTTAVAIKTSNNTANVIKPTCVAGTWGQKTPGIRQENNKFLALELRALFWGKPLVCMHQKGERCCPLKPAWCALWAGVRSGRWLAARAAFA